MMDIAMRRKQYVLQIEGIKTKFYLPNVKTDSIQQYIFKNNNYFEHNNLDYICHQWNNGGIGKAIENNVVLDVGANIGNHTLYYLNECNAKKVYCFEPVVDTYNVLHENIMLNNLSDRVCLYNVGIGNKSGKAIISSYNVYNIGGTTIEMSDDGDISVVAIDDLDIPESVSMVKIDVEGFELFALNGMLKTLEKYKPYLSIEIRNWHKDEVISLLSDLGYSYVMLDQDVEYADYLFYQEFGDV
jgi:methyltransferase, FkbM family